MLHFFLNLSWFALCFFNGSMLYLLCRPFLQVRTHSIFHLLLFLTFSFSSGMVIWVGDNNLLYTLPVFMAMFFLCSKGTPVGRLTIGIIFFCLSMSVCAMADTYLRFFDSYDILCRLSRPVFFFLFYLLLHRRLPENPVVLPQRLWKLMLGLAFMPLCALVAVVLLTYQKYDFLTVNSVAMNQGLVVLPFVCITSLLLLSAILTLAGHAQLEQTVQLASLREVYYQGLQREHTQIRTLRHDLRNHLATVQGLLEQNETEKAIGYLDQIAGSPALSGTRQLCDNEVANVVLTAKQEEMIRKGIDCHIQVSLPRNLPVTDPDLCALLGNALDNAMEAAQKAEDKRVTVHCRADKGLLMLRVENALAGDERPDLSTTKSDPLVHGFGLAGMREIAARYHGSLDARPVNGHFELIVCLPV